MSHTDEAKRKMSLAKMGHFVSEETKEKIRQAHIGNHYPRPAARGLRKAPQTEFKKGLIPWNKGKSNPLWKGANNPAWKGGITSESEKIRKSTRYYEWRKRVFDRDDYTCQMCGERGGKLNADHELPFSKFPALRFELLNGRTLCVDCHKLTPTYGELAKTFDI